MPKTGGTWLNHVISSLGSYQSLGRAHACVGDLDPSLLKNRLVFGTVREACSWYASWWQHGTAYDHLAEQMVLWGRGSTEFRDVLWSLTHPWEMDADDLPEWPGIVWGPPPKDEVKQRATREDIVSGRRGFWTWGVEHIYGEPLQVDALIDTAQLQRGIEQILGHTLDPQAYPPRNTRFERPASALEDARILFDDEMFEWVREADGLMLDRLGYSEPFGPMPSPVLWVSSHHATSGSCRRG